MADIENNFKVRLIPISSLTYGGDPSSIRSSQVAFDVTPSFNESRSAEYAQVSPVHMPGAIQVYKRTNSRTFQVGAHLISRNVSDAIKNMATLQKLRAWLLPYFGEKTNTVSSPQQENRTKASQTATGQNTGPLTQQERDAEARRRIISEGVQLRGAPPDILYLYAYSTGTNDLRGFGPRVNVNRVPVVLSSLDIVYPEDVDYIPVYDPEDGPSANSEPFPRKMDVSLTLLESHSPREFEQFDLLAYKQGNLANF